MSNLELDKIISDIDFFDDWEDKYKYIIELGKNSQSLPENKKTNKNKVDGCASQVWFDVEVLESNNKKLLYFIGDSDALIVKGLAVILFSLFSNKTPEEILQIDPDEELKKLNLEKNLTMQRSNGLFSMIKRIKQEANKYI
ncbi:MAG: SufE family protein [Pseudomonadota bacterium]|nr:SufE family protein [Pseudomonadota bacterium]MEC9392331.1 SufE family protein [Pseudomonadota bacterium]MEC9458323.1 SufE family protein [Pseudomonadota bacterium]